MPGLRKRIRLRLARNEDRRGRCAKLSSTGSCYQGRGLASTWHSFMLSTNGGAGFMQTNPPMNPNKDEGVLMRARLGVRQMNSRTEQRVRRELDRTVELHAQYVACSVRVLLATAVTTNRYLAMEFRLS